MSADQAEDPLHRRPPSSLCRLLILCAIVSGCATTGAESLIVSGETVLIRGPISDTTARRFKEALADANISRVLVASGGGLVEPSLDIANEILVRKLDVEVVGDCFSSCANYIFPEGATKTISGLGVVAWHGNMSHMRHLHTTEVKPLADNDLAEVNRLAVLEDAFFRTIALDSFICWFGKIEPCNARNLYFLDTDDMSKFGLTDVIVRRGYARTNLAPYNRSDTENLRFLKVDWPRLIRPE